MTYDLSGFKAYDLRGRVPDQLDEALARDIGRAYAAFIRPDTVVVGHDIRLTGESLTSATCRTLVCAARKRSILRRRISVPVAESWSRQVTTPQITTA